MIDINQLLVFHKQLCSLTITICWGCCLSFSGHFLLVKNQLSLVWHYIRSSALLHCSISLYLCQCHTVFLLLWPCSTFWNMAWQCVHHSNETTPDDILLHPRPVHHSTLSREAYSWNRWKSTQRLTAGQCAETERLWGVQVWMRCVCHTSALTAQGSVEKEGVERL